MAQVNYYTRSRRLRQFINQQLLNFFQAVLFAMFASAGALSRFFIERRRPLPPLDQDHIKKILLIRLELMGDVLQATPAIRAIRRAYPNAEIVAVTTPYTADVLRHNPSVSRVVTLDVDAWTKPGGPFRPGNYVMMYRFFRSLRDERFDLSVGFFGLISAIFSFIIGARRRVGFRGESYPFMYTDDVPGRRYAKRQHEVVYNLDLARAAGGIVTDDHLEMYVLPEDRATLDAILATMGHDPQRPLVVLHAGATNGSAKRWPTAYFAKLADRLISEQGCQIALTGGQGDRALIDSVLADMRFPALDLVGRTTLGELAALLSQAQAVVCGDSGPLHMAVALGTPVVALHGPTDPAISGPYTKERARVLRLGLECSPCYNHLATAECPLVHQKCLRDLPVELAFRATTGLMHPTAAPVEYEARIEA